MNLPAKIIKMFEKMGWSSLHWTHRGVYLHLEVSELIEAIRGKRGDPTKEAADVLIALMGITESNGIDWASVMSQAEKKVVELETKLQYKGEERFVL